jgi:LrgA family
LEQDTTQLSLNAFRPWETSPTISAGVGVIGNLNLIGREWIPILVASVGSTFLSLFVTAYVMHRISLPKGDRSDGGH